MQWNCIEMQLAETGWAQHRCSPDNEAAGAAALGQPQREEAVPPVSAVSHEVQPQAVLVGQVLVREAVPCLGAVGSPLQGGLLQWPPAAKGLSCKARRCGMTSGSAAACRRC